MAGGGFNKLAVYGLIDSSISFLDAGDGLHLNPVILQGGSHVLFEKISRDTNRDGKITVNDRSDLMILSLSNMKSGRFLPGLKFTNPAISKNNLICAQGNDGNIYLLPLPGLTDKEPNGDTQYLWCDSLAKHTLTYNDSIMAAIACYEAYYYYPERCRDHITRSAVIYAMLDMHYLALDILAEAGSYADSLFARSISLAEARIRYNLSRKKEYLKEKNKAIDICKNLLSDEKLSDSIKKEIYKFCIELYFNEKMYGEGRELIEDGINTFGNDIDIIAALERWDLKYLANTYAGDIYDLTPLYIELIEKYRHKKDTMEIFVKDLIELISGRASGNELDELEKIRINYEWHPLLSGMASLEQAKILARRGRKSLAEWRLKDISEKYREIPGLRFAVFNELVDLYIGNEIYDKAGIMLDSASAYLDFVDDYQTVRAFKIKAAEYYAFSGYERLKSNAEEAREIFMKALSYDANNYNAIWGLAKAGYRYNNKKGSVLNVSRTLPAANLAYLDALISLVDYEDKKKISDLRKSRDKLRKVIEKYPSFPLSYISIAYTDCLLEENSKGPLGLYEEAVELSFKGISLIKENEDLAYGFYLNLGEAYFGLAQYSEAFKYYKSAKEIKPALDNDQNFIKKYGESALYIDSIETATEYFRKLYIKSTAAADLSAKSFAALKLGLLNQIQEKYIEAAELYEEAKGYYQARNDAKTVTDILKAQAFCFRMTGDDQSATIYADEALKSYGKIKYKEIKYDNRVKFVLWPFGISIPLIELLPMRFGGSLYPKGFTRAADEAFLQEMLYGAGDVTTAIALKNRQIGILENSDEEENSVDLWADVGGRYLEIEHVDSSIVSYKKAFKLCMELEDYHGAYVELLNWAEAVFYGYGRSDYATALKQLDEIENKVSDLHDYILPSYPNARANLKNIIGLAEYFRGLVESGNILGDGYSDLQSFMARLNGSADRIHDRFSRAVYHFRDALGELTPGEYPDIETGILLNMAVTSYFLGDFESLRSSITSAKNSAVFSTSPRLYAKLLALEAMIADNNGNSYIDQLKDAIGIYENMPIGRSHVMDMAFLERLYTMLTEYYIKEGDINSGLFYLESMRNMLLVARLNQVNTVLYKTESFRANMDLLRQYQKNLIDLYMEKKRLEAIGVAAKIRLREVSEEILRVRGRILELRQEIKEMDAIAYSCLVFDQPAINSLMGDLTEEELFVITHRISDKIAIWIAGKDSLEMLLLSNIDDFNVADAISDISRFNIVTIISAEEFYEELTSEISKISPGIVVKSAFSLNDTRKAVTTDIRKATEIVIVKFDGSILTNNLAEDIGGGVVYFDSTFSEVDLSRYGWIIIDGKIVKDEENFILSGWEHFNVDRHNNSMDKLYIKDLPKLKNNAFGVIYLDMGNDFTEANNRILNKIIENMGIKTILKVNNIRDLSALESDLKVFFNGLGTVTPLGSYSKAFIRDFGAADNRNKYSISYYGDNGWSRKDEDLYIKGLFDEYVLIANQHYIQKNWKTAERYYNLGLNTVSGRNFDDSKKGFVADKLMKTYENTGEYNYRIRRECERFIDIFKKAVDWRSLAKIYSDMAEIEYNMNEFERSVEYATLLIEMAEKTEDLSLNARGLAARGKAYLETGDLDNAGADLSISLSLISADNKEDRLLPGLYLAKVLNMKGLYGKAKIQLDSLEILIDKTSGNINYREYLIQLSRFQIGTLRNESARRNLEYLLEQNNNDAEATILLGKIYLMREEFDLALEFARKSISLLKNRGKPLLLTEAYESLGDIFRAIDRDDEAFINYRLAEGIARSYKNRMSSDLLMYKIALAADTTENIDSLYHEIMSKSENEYVDNLCRYQLGYHAAVMGDKEKARNYFAEISGSADKNTLRYLGWRAFYNQALLAENNNKWDYLVSAERISKEYFIEPDYIKAFYGLHEDKADLYYKAADILINEGEADSAVSYLEAAYSQKISGRHFSIGNFDSIENRILDGIFVNNNGENDMKFNKPVYDSLKYGLPYGVLWGVREDALKGLQDSLMEGESVLRFYSADSGFIAAYMDRDSIFIHKYEFKEEELGKSLGIMDNLLSDQQKADSVTEEWYVKIISPLEDFLDDKDKILIVPDGILYAFPFEILKMPDGDYLSEMYILKRHAYLPERFPRDSLEETSAVPEFEVGYDPDVRMLQYIAEPLLKPAGISGSRVRFYSGEFSFFDGSDGGGKNIACMVKPFDGDDYLNMALQAVMSARDGSIGFVYPLWETSDEIKAAFYWRFLSNLAAGKGYWDSFRVSRSFIFGHYDGLPNLWGANVFMALN
ncbi:MAG: hypothetical protein JSW64_02025 [Candidatus Zixiibacteriota bacterium]|nr:MAG: hypothetical protein JSW64_02025 [candidate division Zixibacteria bacterium]